MDEQMIERFTQAVEAGEAHEKQTGDLCGATIPICDLRAMLTAHSVIAMKVAALEDALSWAENHDPQLVGQIRARAALAPYPERR